MYEPGDNPEWIAAAADLPVQCARAAEPLSRGVEDGEARIASALNWLVYRFLFCSSAVWSMSDSIWESKPLPGCPL